jgi:multiple sugar transport system ATP-binding protein
MASLTLTNIVKRYGTTTIIHGVDLAIGDGEFVVFVGPSGCGKSTLLRMISGLESVTTGDLLINGKRVNDVSAAQRGLAMVFQSYALYPHMTVYQNLAFGLENLRAPRAEIQTKVHAAARMLKLDTLLDRRPTQLSGGQRQRVAIGRCIVRDPTIFLFDEPLSNLDAELRVQMRTEITGLHDRLGTTMVYVTHDQVEAMTMADKIVVLRAGRIEQVGSPLALYNNPRNRFVAGFIGSPQMNFLDARVVDHGPAGVHVALAAGGATSVAAIPVNADGVQPDTKVALGVRPEHVVVGRANEPALEMSATIERIEQLGAATFLYCHLANNDRLTVHVPGQLAHRAGETITVHAPVAVTHLFRGDEGQAALPRHDLRKA